MDKYELQSLIKTSEEKLRASGIECAAAEIEIILEHLLEVDRIDIYMYGPQLIDNNIIEKFNQIVDKRSTRFPLQYILGESYFYGRKFMVNRDVMVPTPETEILCELAINYIKNEGLESPQILDVGAGSGVISVTVASELPVAWVTSLDISQGALATARKNAAIYGVESQIDFRKSDLFESLRPDEKFDLILSNPPYISEKEYETLPPEVLSDPKVALTSGTEGLDIIKRLIAEAPPFLKEKGRLMFEIGYNQADKIAEISAKDKRYRTFHLIKDLNDIDRVVILSV
ncbi:MAG: peptide chain release factor N(5)-glutamine methyltransferase [Candidatus Zixiibacteriota bacterium]